MIRWVSAISGGILLCFLPEIVDQFVYPVSYTVTMATLMAALGLIIWPFVDWVLHG